MLSNALKKSLSSVYEPTAYKKLYNLLASLFIKDPELIHYDFELQLSADFDKNGCVENVY